MRIQRRPQTNNPNYWRHEGWKGDFRKDCKKDENFYYFFYEHKVFIGKEQSKKLQNMSIDTLCFQNIIETSSDSALGHIFEKHLNRYIVRRDKNLPQIVAKLQAKQKIKLDRVACNKIEYTFNMHQKVKSFTNYKCKCLLYTRIEGGRDTIEQIGRDVLGE